MILGLQLSDLYINQLKMVNEWSTVTLIFPFRKRLYRVSAHSGIRAANTRLSSHCGSALLMWLQGCLNLHAHVDQWVETLINPTMIPVLF